MYFFLYKIAWSITMPEKGRVAFIYGRHPPRARLDASTLHQSSEKPSTITIAWHVFGSWGFCDRVIPYREYTR